MKFTIIDNKIYDVTDFIHEHPGGEQVLLTHVGKDASGTLYTLFNVVFRLLPHLKFFPFVGVPD